MKKFLSDKENATILTISVIAFIIGCLAINPIISFLIIGVADFFLFLPDLKKRIKSKQPSKKENLKEGIKDKVKKDKKEKDPKKKSKKKIVLLVILGFIILCFILGIIFMIYIAATAPKFDPNKLYKKESSIIYDKNGKQIASLGSEKREKVNYNQLPDVLVNAIVATEDSRFFKHNGFDLPRFLKASIKQVTTGGGGGASTLTMQVSKNNYTSTTTSGFEGIKRKFTDIYLSIFQIERKYSKKEIMEFYVNAPYLGSGAYGVEQACQTYFGKSVSDINLAEASLIAGLFQAPNAYDPKIHPEAAAKRRSTVLQLMVRHGYITEKERKKAEAVKVESLLVDSTASGGSNDNKYQGFIDTVTEEVEEVTGNNPYTVPMVIYSTMDPEKQNHINSVMNGESFNWENDVVSAGISVVDVKTGEIAAIGAGRNRKGEKQFNTATMINRQIGSTSKPLYDYAPGIEYENWSTYTPFVDEKYSYSDGTEINNWDRKYNGYMTMRTALAQSRNIPALKAFQKNKNSNIKKFVKSLGLHPEVASNGTLHEAHSIGGYTGESPLAMSGAYAAFGNGGYYIEPHSYTKIKYRENDEEEEREVKKTRVMSEETAYMMTSLLQSSAQGGLGAQANVGGAVFGAKTGTSNYDEATLKKYHMRDSAINDLWVNGVSPDYAISVWYGYEKANSQYQNTSYTISHRKLFQAVAKGIFKNGSNWTRPAGVVEVTVEQETWPAKLPSEYTPADLKVTELFKKGSEPTEVSERFSKLSNVTNLKGSISGNKLTLSWTPIKTPKTLDQAWISESLKSLYSNLGTGIGIRNSYNSSHIGNVVYEVYAKQGGSLNLVKTTTDSSVTLDVNTSSTDTYVVKTSYSIFKSATSGGVETKVSLSNVKASIDAKLKGENSVTVSLNGQYKDEGIIITADGKDVTSKDKYTTTITDASNQVVDKVDTQTPGVYTITYKVNYDSFTKTLTRTVVVGGTVTTQ